VENDYNDDDNDDGNDSFIRHS